MSRRGAYPRHVETHCGERGDTQDGIHDVVDGRQEAIEDVERANEDVHADEGKPPEDGQCFSARVLRMAGSSIDARFQLTCKDR